MKTKIIIILTMLSVQFSLYADMKEKILNGKASFEKKEYLAGNNQLFQVANSLKATPEERVEAFLILSKFYADFIGNYDMAFSLCQRALKESLPPGNDIRLMMEKQNARLKEWHRDNVFLDQIIRSSIGSVTPEERDEKIKQLEAVILQNPDYYRIAEIYQILGGLYMDQKEFTLAKKALSKALALKPCIDFYLPVSGNLKNAEEECIRAVFSKSVWVIIGLFLVVSIILFIMAQPWKWITYKQLTIVLILIMTWPAIFYLSFACLSEKIESSENIENAVGSGHPLFIKTILGSPGSEHIETLLWYGFIALIGVIVFCIGTTVIKSRRKSGTLNLVAGVLFCCAVTVVYYLHHCDRTAVFYSHGKGVMSYAVGHIYFSLPDPERFILTTPNEYHDIAVGNMDAGELQDWIIEHVK